MVLAGHTPQQFYGIFDAPQRAGGLLDELPAKVDGAAVMRAQHKQAHRHQIKFLGNIPHGKKVAGGFAHLLIVDVDVPIVHPVLGKRLSRCALALCNLVFMVWEYQIHPAAVDIQRIAQILHAHGAAFHMPTRAPHAPRAGPGRLAGLLRLPKGKIQCIALNLGYVYPRAGLQFVYIIAR